jgi:hypothetical protein
LASGWEEDAGAATTAGTHLLAAEEGNQFGRAEVAHLSPVLEAESVDLGVKAVVSTRRWIETGAVGEGVSGLGVL